MIGESSYAGFTTLTLNFFATGQELMGAFKFFVLSLGLKEMTLYYIPACFPAKRLYLGPY